NQEVRPGEIGSNGTVSQDGTHVFTTIDPMFFLPVRGSVSAVCFEGEWWIDDADASLARIERALAETGGLLVDLEAADGLEREFRPSVQWFAERVRQLDARRRFGPSQSTLYLDTGAGFNAHETVERHPARTARLLVEYDLGAPGPEVKALRWDPLEGRLCRV